MTMIDLAGLASLSFEASNERREPNVVRMHQLADIMHEPVYQRHEADGHEMRWANEAMARELSQEGWRSVTERDAIERLTVFMDSRGEVVLMFRMTSV
jgi:hypothetical protein